MDSRVGVQGQQGKARGESHVRRTCFLACKQGKLLSCRSNQTFASIAESLIKKEASNSKCVPI